VAGALAAVVAWRTKNTAATLVAGMIGLWALTAL
jgi:branched-subunit amino acid transport protein